jgi:hypothetical protein
MELLPLTNQGKLRITYNWLYSALNCDPGDQSRFSWVLNKVDDTRMTLSPAQPYAGKTLYASVRDDWSWYVQAQAAHSAHWITGVGRNEILGFTAGDLLTISFSGFNGQAIAVDSQISSHEWHRGYRLRSTGTSDVKARTFFMLVDRALQPDLRLIPRERLAEADVNRAMCSCGLSPTPPEVADLIATINK